MVSNAISVMPHTDAISLAVTLGLLLIILKIVSAVSVGVFVEVVGDSIVKEEDSVVISVEIVEVSVATFALFSSLRQIQEVKKSYEEENRKQSDYINKILDYFPYIEKLMPMIKYLSEKMGFTDDLIRKLCTFKDVAVTGKL